MSKMPPNNDQLISMLQELQRLPLPFHPLILVFSTGGVSDTDCVPMKRSPMPKTGSSFDLSFRSVISEAYSKNPSIHDGAIVFNRKRPDDDYLLEAWSMRIVSKANIEEAEPNHGSAYNSVFSLSVSAHIDLCGIISKDGLRIFKDGNSVPRQG